jgi:hypothetical protein
MFDWCWALQFDHAATWSRASATPFRPLSRRVEGPGAASIPLRSQVRGNWHTVSGVHSSLYVMRTQGIARTNS